MKQQDMSREHSLNPADLLSQRTRTASLDRTFAGVKTPAYVFDLELLEDNLAYLKRLAEYLNVKIILAQKAYSLFPTYPLIRSYLTGSTASGLFEAKLAAEEMGGEVHVFSPGYKAEEMSQIVGLANHIYFNSFYQWQQFKPMLDRHHSVGLRVNPETSQVEQAIYNPAAPCSRLGITRQAFLEGVERYGLEGIDGLHFHCLCEENADALAYVVDAFISRFGDYIPGLKWVNFGGGHHLTRADYDVGTLARVIAKFRSRFPVEIYLEPGEAISLDSGFLISEVIDLVENEMNLAILDTSATCHMPDVLEMPYRPRAFLLDPDFSAEQGYPPSDNRTEKTYLEAGRVGEYPDLYRLGGPTCLAGDIIGDYAFPRALRRGDRIVFCDMALYAHVKTNTFNGMPLPDLVLREAGDHYRTVRAFDYLDFKERLGPRR